ncbi:hypothetical protein FDUTEX481_00683 [Tolypothrix sp. PCC 7601]|nr:hypothetical protein FDUTEX481_00683 [Tolypothrix sp. PCC 7601]
MTIQAVLNALLHFLVNLIQGQLLYSQDFYLRIYLVTGIIAFSLTL